MLRIAATNVRSIAAERLPSAHSREMNGLSSQTAEHHQAEHSAGQPGPAQRAVRRRHATHNAQSNARRDPISQHSGSVYNEKAVRGAPPSRQRRTNDARAKAGEGGLTPPFPVTETRCMQAYGWKCTKTSSNNHFSFREHSGGHEALFAAPAGRAVALCSEPRNHIAQQKTRRGIHTRCSGRDPSAAYEIITRHVQRHK